MDIPGPTTQVGIGTDYYVGPPRVLDSCYTMQDDMQYKASRELVLG
jgi:hypothetical protein